MGMRAHPLVLLITISISQNEAVQDNGDAHASFTQWHNGSLPFVAIYSHTEDIPKKGCLLMSSLVAKKVRPTDTLHIYTKWSRDLFNQGYNNY